QWQRPGPEIPP
uniref:Proline-rich peptide 11a n=1 Tax=Bitis gabonica TaxID=8694 RepID=BPPAC_BITGA